MSYKNIKFCEGIINGHDVTVNSERKLVLLRRETNVTEIRTFEVIECISLELSLYMQACWSPHIHQERDPELAK